MSMEEGMYTLQRSADHAAAPRGQYSTRILLPDEEQGGKDAVNTDSEDELGDSSPTSEALESNQNIDDEKVVTTLNMSNKE